MGEFFTNLQVQVQAGSQAQARRKVLTALKEWLAAAGEYLEGAAGDADRTIIIAPNSNGWWSIYDQNTEDQGPSLQELGKSMSARLDTTAVSVLVHDGDVLVLCLFENGRLVDEYNSDPWYFDQAMPDLALSSEDKERLKGNAGLWQAVLPRAGDAEQLRTIWNSHDKAGMEILEDVAEVIGWANENALAGFNSLGENQDRDALFFRRKQRPAPAARAEGPPRFAYYVNMLPRGEQEYEGRQSFEVGVCVRNIGGPLSGLRVEVSGGDIDNGVAEITDVTVRCGAGGSLSSKTAGSEGVVCAEFPGAELHAGLADPGYIALAALGHGIEPVKHNEHHPVVFHGEELNVSVGGFLVAPGTAELKIALVPIGISGGERFVHTFLAIVKEPPPGPEPFAGMAAFLERASRKPRE